LAVVRLGLLVALELAGLATPETLSVSAKLAKAPMAPISVRAYGAVATLAREVAWAMVVARKVPTLETMPVSEMLARARMALISAAAHRGEVMPVIGAGQELPAAVRAMETLAEMPEAETPAAAMPAEGMQGAKAAETLVAGTLAAATRVVRGAAMPVAGMLAVVRAAGMVEAGTAAGKQTSV
jgi:hypothetical protein